MRILYWPCRFPDILSSRLPGGMRKSAITFAASIAFIKNDRASTDRPDQSRLDCVKPTLIATEPVSACEARTHLSKLLERAARGERFVITRHGKPVAQLIPFECADDVPVARTFDRVAALRRRLARQGITLASILESGETPRTLAHAAHRY